MKATDAKFIEFLKKSPQFVIPIYQRTYSWSERECRQLWDDVTLADPTVRVVDVRWSTLLRIPVGSTRTIRQVVHAVRDRLAEGLVRKVVDPRRHHRDGLPSPPAC